MAADKVDMALRHAEYVILGRLEAAVRGGTVAPDAVASLVADTPLIAPTGSLRTATAGACTRPIGAAAPALALDRPPGRARA